MRRLLPALLAPVLTLAACGGNPQTDGGPVVSGSMPDIGAEDDQAARARIAALQAKPITGAAAFRGLTPVEVKAVLGRPGFTRRDAPAEIWQYRGRVCTLDLFLYDDKGSQQVAHATLRGTAPIDEKACLEELTGRNRGTPSS